MENRNNIQYLVCSLGIIFLLSMCSRHKENRIQDHNSKVNIDTVYQYIYIKDSIIYELPDKTTELILKMIKGKNVKRCGLGSNSDESRFSFAFPYADKRLMSKRDSILLLKTNRYLKLKNIYLPIVTETDHIFSNIPRDAGIISDFNFCYVEVDAYGDVLNYFAF